MDLSSLGPVNQIIVIGEMVAIVAIVFFIFVLGFLGMFFTKHAESEEEQEEIDRKNDEIGWPAAPFLYGGGGASVMAYFAINQLSGENGVSDATWNQVQILIVVAITASLLSGGTLGVVVRAIADSRKQQREA